MWNVVLPTALPLITAAYVGLAEAAVELAEAAVELAKTGAKRRGAELAPVSSGRLSLGSDPIASA